MVPWAVTLWGEMPGEVVWVLWDGFVLEGWSWWFKACIWVMGIFEADLIDMPFDDILRFFCGASQNEFFRCSLRDFQTYGIKGEDIKREVRSIHVTDRMLELLED